MPFSNHDDDFYVCIYEMCVSSFFYCLERSLPSTVIVVHQMTKESIFQCIIFLLRIKSLARLNSLVLVTVKCRLCAGRLACYDY